MSSMLRSTRISKQSRSIFCVSVGECQIVGSSTNSLFGTIYTMTESNGEERLTLVLF